MKFNDMLKKNRKWCRIIQLPHATRYPDQSGHAIQFVFALRFFARPGVRVACSLKRVALSCLLSKW
jgi:hypothetical protein